MSGHRSLQLSSSELLGLLLGPTHHDGFLHAVQSEQQLGPGHERSCRALYTINGRLKSSVTTWAGWADCWAGTIQVSTAGAPYLATASGLQRL